MKVFIPKESTAGETRVAATPDSVKKMIAAGAEVAIETGAGRDAGLPDAEFESAGAALVAAEEGWRTADVVLKVAPPSAAERARLAERDAGTVLIGHLDPLGDLEGARELAGTGVTALAMELIPRVTRAQSMDALSSQANIGGYKATLLAATRLGRYFPLLMTAAGTIRPARVVVMGAGVAGLQAVATAKRLGAVVEVSDIRPEVAEQVASLGGRFIELPQLESGAGEGGYAKEMGEDFLTRQRQVLTEHVAAANVVITTAQVPGKKAPVLLTREMVEAMRPGSVIVDMAAGQGGNCELSRPDEEVDHGGVLILGPVNLPATVPHDASMLYARNVLELWREITDEGELTIDPDNEIIAGCLLTHQGQVVNRRVAEALAAAGGAARTEVES